MGTRNYNETIAKLKSKIGEIFKDKDISKLSDYEKRRIIFDYLCDTLEYDYELLKNIRNPKWYKSGNERDPYGEFESVIDNNIGICNAISQYYVLLLEQVGIESYTIFCTDDLAGGHALNIVYDKDHDTYSLDDVTSVIVGLGDKSKYFDYSFTMASLYGQGNKPVDEDKKWLIMGPGYIDIIILDKRPARDCHFVDIPSNVKSVKIMDIDFYSLKKPPELMEFMDQKIEYGWLDKDGGRHVNDLTGLRENYRVSSLEETLESGLGTCIEQANMIRTFFDMNGIEAKIFCHRSYETEENFDKEVRMHCFVLFKGKEKWYHFEHANQGRKGIHPYDSVENAIKDITGGYKERGDIRKLTEIPIIPSGLSFKEVNEFVNSFDNDTKTL